VAELDLGKLKGDLREVCWSPVPGVKDALQPAWSTDGSRIAWVQKSGPRKFTLMWATVAKG
jgi:hypothetical protein